VSVVRLPRVNAYELAVVSALRAHQLMQGSVPRLQGEHKATTMALMEVSLGKVARIEGIPNPR
jgi:DNA-directed RNA polymerase subunit K/omega